MADDNKGVTVSLFLSIQKASRSLLLSGGIEGSKRLEIVGSFHSFGLLEYIENVVNGFSIPSAVGYILGLFRNA